MMKGISFRLVSFVLCACYKAARLQLPFVVVRPFLIRGRLVSRLVPSSRLASRCLLAIRIISPPPSSRRASRFIHFVMRLVYIRLVVFSFPFYPHPTSLPSPPPAFLLRG